MTRLEYLRYAVLDFLQFLFPPEKPTADALIAYGREKERQARKSQELPSQPTIDSWEEPQQQPPVPMPTIPKKEQQTDELDVLVKAMPKGEMWALWRWQRGAPREAGETFTEQLRAIRKPPQS